MKAAAAWARRATKKMPWESSFGETDRSCSCRHRAARLESIREQKGQALSEFLGVYLINGAKQVNFSIFRQRRSRRQPQGESSVLVRGRIFKQAVHTIHANASFNFQCRFALPEHRRRRRQCDACRSVCCSLCPPFFPPPPALSRPATSSPIPPRCSATARP